MRVFFGWGIFLCSLTGYADPKPELKFIENKNQWNADIQFRATLSNGQLNFFKDKIQFGFYRAIANYSDKGTESGRDQTVHESGTSPGQSSTMQVHVYNVEFVNANPFTVIIGEEKLSTLYNYFTGNDRSRWASGVSSYGKLRYNDLYCGIDMQYFTQQGRLKYEWIVSPYTDPSVIALKYNGVDELYVDNGNLHVKTSVNEVWEMKPLAYQWIDGKKVIVPCEYVVWKNEVRYAMPEGYDNRYELIIDPILIFSAYSGSTLDNWGNTATYDLHGNVYSGGMVAGAVNSTGFPATPGAYQLAHKGGVWDIGILKYDSAGANLLYCTYLGGTGAETPQSLVVNSAGELLILGATSSTDFPVTDTSKFSGGTTIDPLEGVFYSGGTDLFVAKLSEDGTQLTGATYLGGSKNDGVNFIAGQMNTATMQESPLACNYGDQLRGDIITDENNFVYIASNTLSDNFPIVNSGTPYGGGGFHDGVVVKLAPDLSAIVWSRYIGGAGTDAAYSIKLDKSGNIFVAGGTNSTTIPGMNGYSNVNHGGIDAWVMSFTPDGTSVINGTFLGTAQYDQGYFIDLDEDDDVYVFGQTKGSYEIRGNVYTNPNSGQFIQKLSHDLTAPLFSTVVGTGGNSPNISPTAFLVSDCGYIYLSGWGGSTNSTQIVRNRVTITRRYVGGSTTGLPISSDAYQSRTTGSDFYFMSLSADASQLLYSTFLGGNRSATHVDGGTSRFDKQGIVYHAVCASCGGNSDFPAVNVPPAHQSNQSPNCNNAVFKFDLSLLKARLQTNSVALNMPGLNKVCIPDPIVFQNRSSGGEIFEWDLGDGTKISKTDTSRIIHQYALPGKYIVWLKAIDKGTCQVKDSTTTTIEVFMAQGKAQEDEDLCFKTRYQLKVEGGVQYAWLSEDGSFQSGDQNPFVTPLDTTVYYVTITEATGCIHQDTVQLNVIPFIIPEFEMQQESDCFSVPTVFVKNLTDSLWADDQMFFDFGDGVTSDESEVQHQFEHDGVYKIKLVAVRGTCVSEKIIPVTAFRLSIPNVITPGAKDGKNDTFMVRLGEKGEAIPNDYGFKVAVALYNRWGVKVYASDDYQQDWSGDGLASGVYFYEVTVENHTTCRSWIHVIR
jgi:hypothetical protein